MIKLELTSYQVKIVQGLIEEELTYLDKLAEEENVEYSINALEDLADCIEKQLNVHQS